MVVKAMKFTGKKPPTKELGEAILKTRVSTGKSQPEFGRLFNRDYVSIRRWEAGQVTPHRTALADLLKLAPREVRHVFEDYLGKTFDQVQYEAYMALATQPEATDPQLQRDPVGNADRISSALQNHCKWLWGEARSGNLYAAESLIDALDYVVRLTERAQRHKRGE